MKKFLIVLALALISTQAFAQSSIFNATYPLAKYQAGFRTINGNQLNSMVNEVNSLTGTGAAHPVTGTTGSFTGHLITGATSPALTSCGTTPAIVGSDTAGEVTMGTTATGCVITFATAYTSAPICTVTWQATPLASQSYSISTTAITTVQTSTSNNKLDYICVAQSGG